MSNQSRIESIFFAALDKTSSTEREDYLDRACGDDDALRHRVERLLDVHPRVANFLANPAVDLMEFDPRDGVEDLTRLGPPSGSETFPTGPTGRAGLIETLDDEENLSLGFLPPSERPGSMGRLAHYELLETLGSGGSAIVVKAFDEKLHRNVALKILSPLLATTSAARKRFGARRGRPRPFATTTWWPSMRSRTSPSPIWSWSTSPAGPCNGSWMRPAPWRCRTCSGSASRWQPAWPPRMRWA